MGITSNFLKLRSTGTPKIGEWNKDYSKTLDLAKKNGKFIVTCWSNGDNCGYCTILEECMMDKVFTNWIKTTDAYFVFQYSGDSDKGKTVKNWIYTGTGLKFYPGIRVTLYDSKGNIVYDIAVEGNKLRNSKTKTNGAKEIIANFDKMFANKPANNIKSEPVQDSKNYKIRLNEKLTVAKVNKILDAIDKSDGYCPCQPKSESSKCHCEDFIKNKKIGEVCICNIYVKQKK